MSAEILEFFRHGGALPERPLQPPDLPPAPEPRDFTQAEKLALIRRMAKHAYWRSAVLEALPESDSYDLFLNGILFGDDKSTADLAREVIVRYIESCLEGRQEDWEDYT